MNERTTKIESIYLAAMELSSPEERERYLNEACAGDPVLRREVDALLQSAEAADAFFQAGREACRVAEANPVPVLTEKPGDYIGRYKLLQKIGEGGMGVVYMAEQREPVVRKVALKIIKLGMDTRQVVARFEAERQALALMDHPNIAQVLDGGATETGRPYFVMELVQGTPITEFCHASQLSIEERLKLFTLVCQAIQSAHQKGIIHRDIKPSNVLVTMHNGLPHPMVIDFGVARAINQRLTEKTLFTNFATMIGTPAYMSPEQAEMSKLDMDTRSDIYSLGVLLYELLTGSTPFSEERLRGVAYGEMQRVIAEEEPERPSTRLRKKSLPESAAQLATRHSSLPTDLDWIVMKCLEKDRNRRYETANGLANDIQRHLSNEPIVARPPSAVYRFQKLVRRNKLKFAMAAFAVGVLLLAVLVSTWQAVKAMRAEGKARDQAEFARQESEKARLVKDFLVEQVLGVNPYLEAVPDPNRRALVEKVERAIGEQFTTQPRVEADLRYALGEAFSGLGDPKGMIRQVERALELRRLTLGITNSDTLWALASTAAEYCSIGRTNEGERLFREGLAVVRASPHALSSGEAEVLCEYAGRRFEEGHPAEALALMQEAMPVAKQTADPKSWRFQNKLMWFAHMTGMAGRTNEAEAMFNEQIRERERIFGPEHPMTAQLIRVQAIFFDRLGRVKEAVASYQRAISVYYRSLGTNHYMTCVAETDLARVYDRQGHREDAAKLYLSAYPRLADNTNYIHLLVIRMACLEGADFFMRNRMVDDAKAVLGQLTKFFEQNPPSEPIELQEFSQVEFLLGQVSESECRIDEALNLWRRADDAGYTPARFNLAERLARQGRWKEAAASAYKVRELEPANHVPYHMLAPLLVADGELGSYRELCRSILSRFSGTTNAFVADRMAKDCLILPSSGADFAAVGKLADTAVILGKNEEGLPYFQCTKALAEYRSGNFAGAAEWSQRTLANPSSPRLTCCFVEGYMALAMAQHQMSQTNEARATLAKGVAKADALNKLETGDIGPDWRDWIIAHALMKEAKALIHGETAASEKQPGDK
jgi:tetratricopeptide (TPR) repeat protein